MNKTIGTFALGEFCEGCPWELIRHHETDMAHCSGKPCKHCSVPVGNKFICPCVVMASNEGGANGTAVCLDCILEAWKGVFTGAGT